MENIVEANCKNDPTMHCLERSFVRLPGYVDVEIYSTNSLETLKETPLKIAATVCKLQTANEMQLMQYGALSSSRNEAVFCEL